MARLSCTNTRSQRKCCCSTKRNTVRRKKHNWPSSHKFIGNGCMPTCANQPLAGGQLAICLCFVYIVGCCIFVCFLCLRKHYKTPQMQCVILIGPPHPLFAHPLVGLCLNSCARARALFAMHVVRNCVSATAGRRKKNAQTLHACVACKLEGAICPKSGNDGFAFLFFYISLALSQFCGSRN